MRTSSDLHRVSDCCPSATVSTLKNGRPGPSPPSDLGAPGAASACRMGHSITPSSQNPVSSGAAFPWRADPTPSRLCPVPPPVELWGSCQGQGPRASLWAPGALELSGPSHVALSIYLSPSSTGLVSSSFSGSQPGVSRAPCRNCSPQAQGPLGSWMEPGPSVH